jgi:hypothetical protein
MGTPHIGMGRDMSIFQIGESPYRYGAHSNLGTDIHTLQLIGLSISKAYSLLLCNATRTFQLHPTAPTFDLYSYLTLEDTYPVST